MMGLIERTVAEIPPIDDTARAAAAGRQDTLTKPPGSLGRLEGIAIDAAGIMGTSSPHPDPCALVLAAADHGVSEEGVSAYPKEVTAQMVHNFLAGGAAINAIARSVGVEIFLVDAGVDGEPFEHPGLYDRKVSRGSANFARGPAMSADQAARIVETGIELAHDLYEQGFRAIALGDMGIGNTTSAAAVIAAITGAPVETVTGRGTMIGDEQYQRKMQVVRGALARGDLDNRDGMAVLAAVGGYESGFLAGCVLGAAARRMPVVVDGLPTTAAALLADRISNHARRFCLGSHVSMEPGHRVALDFLGLNPLLDLDMRLGEGTGAVLAYSIIRAACRCLNEMASFAEASVEGRLD